MTPSHRFSLEVSINSVACDVTVNDVPVVRSYSGDRLDMVIPVSDFVASGVNTVAIRTLIDRSEVGRSATLARARLLATPYHQTDWQPLLVVATRAVVGAEGEATDRAEASLLGPVSPQSSVFDPEIMLLETTRAIDLQAAVPAWAWRGSQEIAESDDVEASLLAWYRYLFEALQSRQPGAIAAMLGEKVSELSLAHNFARGVVEHEIGLQRAMMNPDLRLRMPDWDALLPEYGANNRLVRLYHPKRGAVVSYTSENGVIYTFDFWLRLQGTAWVIAR